MNHYHSTAETLERMEAYTNATNPERLEIRDRKYESNGSDNGSGVCDNAGDSDGMLGLERAEEAMVNGMLAAPQNPEPTEECELVQEMLGVLGE